MAKPYQRPNPGPYPQDQPQRNTVRFTPVQVGINPPPLPKGRQQDCSALLLVPFPTRLDMSLACPLAQVEAIRSGLNPGLTMVVGPPGTGKTDVAVQIISNLYHAFPSQKTLLVTHSNAALNDLFEKIMVRDIDPR